MVIDKDAELRLNMEKFVEGMKGRLLWMSQTTYTGTGQNLPAVDFRVENDVMVAQGRFIVRDNDVYTVIYAAMKGREAGTERNRFLTGFQIGR